jgi:hypothetical protein
VDAHAGMQRVSGAARAVILGDFAAGRLQRPHGPQLLPLPRDPLTLSVATSIGIALVSQPAADPDVHALAAVVAAREQPR